jgi:ethanolamine utilization microcompartment shell protein EutL
VIYKTAAEQYVSSNVHPPQNDEWVNRAGYYLASERHAYVDGTVMTLCGSPLSAMMAMWSELNWRDGGAYPPRCGTCSALAV